MTKLLTRLVLPALGLAGLTVAPALGAPLPGLGSTPAQGVTIRPVADADDPPTPAPAVAEVGTRAAVASVTLEASPLPSPGPETSGMEAARSVATAERPVAEGEPTEPRRTAPAPERPEPAARPLPARVAAKPAERPRPRADRSRDEVKVVSGPLPALDDHYGWKIATAEAAVRRETDPERRAVLEQMLAEIIAARPGAADASSQ
ncbi:MAG: hypothetical protein ACFCGT_01450 [Sandaracinaceae bacterium]